MSTLRITVTVKVADEEADKYDRWKEIGKFEADAPPDEVWEVYRTAVASLTPEARA